MTMCKPPPGPRCASHAATELAAAQKAARAAVQAYQALAATDGEAQTWAEQSTTRVDLHTARTTARDAIRAVDEAQRIYDSTPTGQRRLEAALAAAEQADDHETAKKTRARLTTARAFRDTVMARWRASSAYSEERLSDLVADNTGNLATVTDRLRELRTEIVHRRAAERDVLLPPTHHKARTVWESSEPRGRTWRAVADLTSPATASLTYTDPQVHAAAQHLLAATEDPAAVDALHAAVAHSLPAALAAPDDVKHHMYRAAATGRPWAVSGAALAQMVLTRGTRMVDPDGAAAADGHPGDRWRIHRVVGPVRITGGHTAINVTSGWVCARERDEAWRVLDDRQVSDRLDEAGTQHAVGGNVR